MRRIAVLSAAVLMLSACGEDVPELTATDVSSLRVTGQREQISMYSAGLSPDGETLLYINESGTCLRGVDDSDEHCLEHGTFLDTANASWSPDGSRIAITDEFLLGREPDVWVLDVGSAELTNLTDDGVEPEGMSLAGDVDFPADADVDVYPSWSADGKRIRFLRKESDGIALMSIPADGGEPDQLGSIDTAWGDLQSAAWAEDTVAWLSGPSEGGGGEVLVADVDGDDQHKVLDGEYRLLSFSSDGAFLLADQQGEEGAPAVGKARVVPTTGGDPVRVAAGDVTYPTWAPEGHAIAYVEGPGTVRVVGKPGAEPRDLHTESTVSAANGGNLDWVPGAMLVMTGEDTPVVLRVNGK